MILRPKNPTGATEWSRNECPSLIDLAALCDGRVHGDHFERLEVHLAACKRCMSVMRGLRTELRDIDQASRLTLVPAHVLKAAMDLRPRDRTDLDKDIKVAVVSHPLDTRLWVRSARRGVAAAAMLGVIVGGYYVGYSFSGSSDQESGSAHLASNNDADATSVTFGLLDMTTAADRELMAEEDEGFGLFALAAREGQS